MDFTNKLSAAWSKNNSLVCVGLDPDVSKMPSQCSGLDQPFYEFNKAIIDATADLVCAFKLNTAFYEALGSDGINQLKLTVDYINKNYPELPFIVDAKRADIGNTNDGSVKFIFEYLKADAVTVNPYMGKAALEPFLALQNKGIFVLCRTSNEGASEFQDLPIEQEPLYQYVARRVHDGWNGNNNCCLVVGAPSSDSIKAVREIVGNQMALLVPGAGAQGGDIAKVVEAGVNESGTGLIISSSRAILYTSGGEDYVEAARREASKMRDEINEYRA
jgi:orotidine-5'-phosphate decarboxylase